MKYRVGILIAEGWHTCRPAPKSETLAYTETARRTVNTRFAKLRYRFEAIVGSKF